MRQLLHLGTVALLVAVIAQSPLAAQPDRTQERNDHVRNEPKAALTATKVIANKVAAPAWETSPADSAAPLPVLDQSVRVRDALDAQDAWLKGQANGRGWDAYLQTAELREQLALGDQADGKKVQEILSRYEAPEPGLRLPRFTATRKALAAWSEVLNRPTLEELPKLVQLAKEKFRPEIPKREVWVRLAAAEGAIKRLNRFLRDSGSDVKGWRAFLRMDELEAELKKQLGADPDVLDAIASKYVTGENGLEMPAFASAGRALREFADMLAAYKEPMSEEAYKMELDELAKQLDVAVSKPDDVNRQELAESIQRLATAYQATDLVRAVRQYFVRPNLIVHVEEPIVVGGINEPVDEPTPINDVILGTQVSGKGRTKGELVASLRPNSDLAAIQLQLTGKTDARTVGHNGPATIFSRSITGLSGVKQLTFDADGFRSGLANACAKTQTFIEDICIAGGPLITRIATRRIYGSKSTAEAIASNRAARRLEGRMDSRTGEFITRANSTYNRKFRNALTRRGALPELQFSTTDDWLTIIGIQARPEELAANTPAPEPAAGTQLSVRMHETLIDNFTAALLGGNTIRQMAYRRTMRDLAGEPYSQAEFVDFLLCMAETGAPVKEVVDGQEVTREEGLVVSFDNFSSLMKDRYKGEVKDEELKKDYVTLTRALYDERIGPVRTKYGTTLSKAQYEKYLAGLAKDPISYEDAIRLLRESQVNYSAIVFANSEPVKVRFRDDLCQVKLKIDSIIQRRLDRNGRLIVNSYPAEVYATYRCVTKPDGSIDVQRVEGEYGVKPLPPPGGAEVNLPAVERRRRNVLLTKTLPRLFFGTAIARDDDEPAEEDVEKSEPIFPELRSSRGLTLRGRWEKLGEMPWTQFSAQDGWLALGWKLAAPESPAPQSASLPNEVQ